MHIRIIKYHFVCNKVLPMENPTPSFDFKRLGKPKKHDPATPVQAVLFDAYGTLFDVYSITALAESFFAGQGQALANLWRDKQIEYTRLVSMSGRHSKSTQHASEPRPFFQSFWDITVAALRYSCQKLDLPLNTQQEQALMQSYRHLSAYPEAKEVLQALHARGIATGILSNGDPDMLQVATESAQLQPQHLISVAPLRLYKTDPAAYALGTQTLGLEPEQVLFVSSNSWDALGASWWGYNTLWVNRKHLPFETLGTLPDFESNSLHGVVHALQALQDTSTAPS